MKKKRGEKARQLERIEFHFHPPNFDPSNPCSLSRVKCSTHVRTGKGEIHYSFINVYIH